MLEIEGEWERVPEKLMSEGGGDVGERDSARVI